MTQEHVPFVFPMQIGSPSADDAIVAGAYFYAHRKCKITSAVLVNGVDVVASDSNFAQVELKNGSNIVAELDTRAAHENGLTADVAKAMNLVAANTVLAKGSTLTAKYEETDAGTNVALTNAVLIISGYWVGSAD